MGVAYYRSNTNLNASFSVGFIILLKSWNWPTCDVQISGGNIVPGPFFTWQTENLDKRHDWGGQAECWPTPTVEYLLPLSDQTADMFPAAFLVVKVGTSDIISDSWGVRLTQGGNISAASSAVHLKEGGLGWSFSCATNISSLFTQSTRFWFDSSSVASLCSRCLLSGCHQKVCFFISVWKKIRWPSEGMDSPSTSSLSRQLILYLPS